MSVRGLCFGLLAMRKAGFSGRPPNHSRTSPSRLVSPSFSQATLPLENTRTILDRESWQCLDDEVDKCRLLQNLRRQCSIAFYQRASINSWPVRKAERKPCGTSSPKPCLFASPLRLTKKRQVCGAGMALRSSFLSYVVGPFDQDQARSNL